MLLTFFFIVYSPCLCDSVVNFLSVKSNKIALIFYQIINKLDSLIQQKFQEKMKI